MNHFLHVELLVPEEMSKGNQASELTMQEDRDILAASGKQKTSLLSSGLGLNSQSPTQCWGLEFSVKASLSSTDRGMNLSECGLACGVWSHSGVLHQSVGLSVEFGHTAGLAIG